MKKIIKILIVDDEQENVHVMQEILSFHQQYRCKGCCSGEEALNILKTYFPDIILLDVMMPGLNGYEVCKQIRAEHQRQFSKIIMVSGMSTIEDRLKGYEAGADDYLTKPYVEGELLAKLEVYSKLNRMEELDALKTTALNILSHETRTPLNGIILGSELLDEIEGLPEKAKTYLALVRESGLKIQDLVTKITRYYSVKDGLEKNVSHKPLCLEINSIISSLLESGLCKTMLKCSCDETIVFQADWSLLKEAIGYVVDNAYRNTKKDSFVTINCWKKSSDVYIHISNQGSGIEPSLAKRLFDGLFIPDLLHHRQGTGLSLAIAKEIIEEHGGQISCGNLTNDGQLQGTLYEIVMNNIIK
jgi:DNA-binding response OmpR family regulator